MKKLSLASNDLVGYKRQSSGSSELDNPEAYPRLEQWFIKLSDSGSGSEKVRGRCYGHKNKPEMEGEIMDTSAVPVENRYRTYVVTASGNTYRLGTPKDAESKSAYMKSLPKGREVEAASGPQQGEATVAGIRTLAESIRAQGTTLGLYVSPILWFTHTA